MLACLVTGNPGSGKSTVCAELARRGFLAIDTDSLAHWIDEAGRRADSPVAPDAAWLASHRWVWSRSTIARVIAEGAGVGPMFFCGIARNQGDMLDLFDRVFLLMIDSQTQDARLNGPQGPLSSPRTEAEKAQVRDGRPIFQAEMLAHGATPIDATPPTSVVVDRLLAHLRLDR